MSENFFSLVLQDAPRPLDMTALVLQLRQLTAPIGLSVELLRNAQGSEPAMVGVGGVPFTVIAVATPVPPGTMERAVAATIAWNEAAAAVAAHGAHLIVGCVQQPKNHEHALHFAMLTTFVTAAALDMSEGLGAYWASGEMMLSPDGMRRAVRAMLSKTLPVEDWVNLMWFRGETAGQSQTVGAATIGMRPFFGLEIEFLPAAQQPVELAQRIFGLIRYLLMHGMVIRDGETFGDSETDITRVRFLENGSRVPGRVMQLSMETGGPPVRERAAVSSERQPSADAFDTGAPAHQAGERMGEAAAPERQPPEAMVAFPEPIAGIVLRRPVFGRRSRG